MSTKPSLKPTSNNIDKQSSKAEQNNWGQQPPRLIPVAKWNQYHEWPTVGTIRNWIFRENFNGLHKAVKRIGRRVLLDEKLFFEWLQDQEVNNVGKMA
jgi:hypothetical protein